ncbi:hypothetical protein PG995_012743 [Apiospora arundinis]
MGSPTGGGPPAVTTSIIPNPSASAAANNTIGKGIVAAGLSDASLKKLYASIPESQHSTVKVLNVNDDEPTGYVECYPLWGAPANDCTQLTNWINNRTTVTDYYEVDAGYCWDAQQGTCRAFLCAEGDDGWLVTPGIFAQVMGGVVSACAPEPNGDSQSGAWHWNATGFEGGNVYITLFTGTEGLPSK